MQYPTLLTLYTPNAADLIALTLCVIVIGFCLYIARVLDTRAALKRTRPDMINAVIMDAAAQYVSVRLLGYTARDARAHVRARLHAYQSFSNQERDMIVRLAVARANDHLNKHPAHPMKDINERPVYPSGRAVTQRELDYFNQHGTVKGYQP